MTISNTDRKTCANNNLSWFEEPCDSCCGSHSGYIPKKKAIRVELSDPQYTEIEELAKDLKITRGEMVNRLLDNALDRLEGKG